MIRVVDFETTGMAPPAKVIEVGFCDVMSAAGVATGQIRAPALRMDELGWQEWPSSDRPDSISTPVYASRLFGADAVPPEARAVHHISPVRVMGLDPFYAQPFVQAAAASGAIALAAHNAEFEAQWLAPVLGKMPMVCTYKAALRLWPEAPAHNNQTLRYWLEDQGLIKVNPDLAQPAHRAGPDAYVTALLLGHILTKVDLADLVQWTTEPKLMPTCPIGKFRGKKWADVEGGFLVWMLRQTGMEHDLQWNAQRELDRRSAERGSR